MSNERDRTDAARRRNRMEDATRHVVLVVEDETLEESGGRVVTLQEADV